MDFLDLGLVPFRDALSRQEETVARIVAGEVPETVFLLEHPHVFTVGRAGKKENLLAPLDWQGHSIDLIRINRGGDVTYHGPGQLVGYPHIDLRPRGRDVHRYLRSLEETLVRTAAHFGIQAFRRAGLTGVWTGEGKLASIGVGVRHWITMHGFALNVNPDIRYFQLINPCGIANCRVTSLTQLIGSRVEMEAVKRVYRGIFAEVFG